MARDEDEVATGANGEAAPARITVTCSDGKHLLIQRFALVVCDGPDAGRRWTSASDRMVIGTYASADVVLRDDTVSRFHCEIVLAHGRAVLTDMGSRNGTRVDGTWIASAYLRDGAVVSVGRTRLCFEVRDEHVQLPLSERTAFGALVGRSTAMRRLFTLLEHAAACQATVVLLGETGTGKDLAAESIHRESGRREGPFVTVDCAAIPSALLESEFFGHERGAFTGADTARHGAFVAASGGTLFLDEIGELPLDLQPKLLRVLERREVKRIGAATYQPVDVRVISATNRCLQAAVNARQFRSDLFYRLAVLELSVPPLRQRRDDLPMLVDCLIERMGLARLAAAAVARTPEFLAELERHTWPGNVRELRNYLERSIAFGEPSILAATASSSSVDAIDATLPFKAARQTWTDVFERRYLEDLMRRHDGNASAAARASGLDRMSLYRLLWRHGLR